MLLLELDSSILPLTAMAAQHFLVRPLPKEPPNKVDYYCGTAG